jgi:hypothetical protein
MITIEQAKALKHGDILFSETLKDSKGYPLRVRVSGKLKTWVRSPNEFRLPIKYGLYQSSEVTDATAHLWSTTAPNQGPYQPRGSKP